MSKNNFKILCLIFVLQIGWGINFTKAYSYDEISVQSITKKPSKIPSDRNNLLDKNLKDLEDLFYQLKILTEKAYSHDEISEHAINIKPNKIPTDGNNLLDKNMKDLEDLFFQLKIQTEKDYNRMTEIVVSNLNLIHSETTKALNKILKEIEILKQSSNDGGTCVNNQNETDSKLDKVLSEIVEASEVARNFSLEQAVCDERGNSSDPIPDNNEIDYFFGVGELVKFDIRMVCIKPVTKLSTRPKGTPPTLFHTGKFYNYYDALKECENRDGVVFIPKTMEENDLWITFAKNSHKSARISEAFYPKTYYHEIKRFLWADCSENSSFFKIKLVDNQFYKLAPGYVTLYSNSVGAICIKYRHVNFFSDHCERSREGFAICERI